MQLSEWEMHAVRDLSGQNLSEAGYSTVHTAKRATCSHVKSYS